MPPTPINNEHSSSAQSLLRSLSVNCRITLYLLDNLDPLAWRVAPPADKGRDIASVFTHIHSVRLMWLKANGHEPMPTAIVKETVTIEKARKALEESAVALEVLVRNSVEGDGRIKNFKPDVYSFVGYLVAHEAHHRGQASLLARFAGYPISKQTNFGMWEWGTR
jgi:uncharacterized damage-inducible protein DinB